MKTELSIVASGVDKVIKVKLYTNVVPSDLLYCDSIYLMNNTSFIKVYYVALGNLGLHIRIPLDAMFNSFYIKQKVSLKSEILLQGYIFVISSALPSYLSRKWLKLMNNSYLHYILF